MMRLSLGALLIALATACKPPAVGPTAAPGSTAPVASTSAPPPGGTTPSALDTERTRATERALGMIGRNEPALGARIAAAELADPMHGLPANLREMLNTLAGDGLDASRRSLLIRTAFEEDDQLRAAFDATCKPGWSALGLASLAEGQRPALIAEACKAHPAAQPSDKPPAIALAIPLSIGIEGVLRAQHAPALELRLARALMFMAQ